VFQNPFVMPRRRAVIGTILQDAKLSALMTGCHVSTARNYCLMTREPQAMTVGKGSFGNFSLKTNSSGTNLNSRRLAQRASYKDVACKSRSPERRNHLLNEVWILQNYSRSKIYSHSFFVTGITDNRFPFCNKCIFCSGFLSRSSVRVITRFILRLNFTSTRYQVGFSGLLLGS